MKACRVHRFGSPEVILFEDVPRPEPSADELLVRVVAAGVGPWDAWIRAGKSALPQPLPLTLGSDFSGKVVGIGRGVRGFSLDEDAYGATNKRFTGAYAEFAVATASMAAKKPRTLTHRDAASIPVVAVTAYQMLFDHARVEAGQRVLIHGAAGNVGAFAVDLARARGAHVIGTDVKTGLGSATGLAAERLIDTTTTRFEDVAGSVDAVIDTVGGDLQTRSFSVLKPGGVLVSSVSEPDAKLAADRGVRALFMLVDVTTGALTQIADLLDAGALRPRVGSTIPLSEARAAHEMLEGLRPRDPGKIVLLVG